MSLLFISLILVIIQHTVPPHRDVPKDTTKQKTPEMGLFE